MGNSHKKERRCVMFGLADSGKTTILYRLLLDEIVTTIPTIGFNKESIKYKNFNITITECGGKQPRQGWRHYYSKHNNYHPIDTIIWVLDATKLKVIGFGNRYKTQLIVHKLCRYKDLPTAIIEIVVDYCFIQDKNELEQTDMLHSIIKDEELKNAQLLIYANKSDLIPFIANMEMPTTESIADILMLTNSINIPYHIQLCSATSSTADGLWQGLDWIIK